MAVAIATAYSLARSVFVLGHYSVSPNDRDLLPEVVSDELDDVEKYLWRSIDCSAAARSGWKRTVNVSGMRLVPYSSCKLYITYRFQAKQTELFVECAGSFALKQNEAKLKRNLFRFEAKQRASFASFVRLLH